MDVSKLCENVNRVAYCGGMDPKDYTAFKSVFPNMPNEAYPNYVKTYDSVVNGECELAVLPFDNSHTGENGMVLDLIFAGNLKIVHTFVIQYGDVKQRYAVLARDYGFPANESPGFMLMFTVADEVGALAKAINAISDHGFNMRIMRSRPLQGLAWRYYFYVEARGIIADENGREMLTELEKSCKSVKLVGQYSIDN